MKLTRHLRLATSEFWFDVRLTHMDGRWIASAATPDGPTLGLGRLPLEALAESLEPFDGAVDELLTSLPEVLYWG
jgi:hypothetical protein